MKRATVVTALTGALVALAVVGVFMALDRTVLHWYAQDFGPIERGLERDIDDVARSVSGIERAVRRLTTQAAPTPRAIAPTAQWIYVPEEDAENAANYPGEGLVPCADFHHLHGRTAYPGSQPFTEYGETWVPVQCWGY